MHPQALRWGLGLAILGWLLLLALVASVGFLLAYGLAPFVKGN